MKKRNIVFLLIAMSLILILSGKMLYARQIDLFSEIVNETNSNVIEYGVRASFVTDSIDNETLKEILKNIGYYDSDNMVISIENNINTIEFISGDTYGFIESVKQEDKTYVTVDIKEKNMINNINMLKSNIENAINSRYENVKYYMYLKSQLKQGSLAVVNNQIKKILINSGAKDIDTVDIDNGFSTVAYTKKYESIKNDGRLIDFNYAVTSYNTGSYIIIGTPVIKESY